MSDKRKIREAFDWLFHMIVAIVAGILIVTFVGQRTIVYDISMEPTLMEGDNLLVEKLGIRFGWIKSGDIVVFKPPGSDRQLIKRVVAVEGDKVELKGGRVFVNGEALLIGLPREEETPEDSNGNNELTVPEGYFYVLGDNRPYSIDSTELGPIGRKQLTGRAIFRFFPFNKFGNLK